MKFNGERKLITCVTPKGKCLEIITALHERKNIHAADVSGGRGEWHHGTEEVDILTVVVEAERADEIFEFIYREASIDEPDGGFIYQGRLLGATHFVLPQIPDEED